MHNLKKFNMKKYNLLFPCLLAFLLTMPNPFGMLHAQDAPTIFFEMECIKTKSDDFIPIMKEEGMKFNKTLIEEGVILDWVLMQVIYPNGRDCDCDYYMVTVMDNMKHLDYLWSREKMGGIIKKVMGDRNMDALMNRFEAAAEPRGSMVYQMMDEVIPGPEGNGGMAQINFMTVPQENADEYISAERNVWKPIHKEATKAGMMKDWMLAGRVFPRGTDWAGNYITIDMFDSFEQMSKMNMWEAAQKAHPGKDLEKVLPASSALREISRSETWKWVMSASDEMRKEKG